MQDETVSMFYFIVIFKGGTQSFEEKERHRNEKIIRGT